MFLVFSKDRIISCLIALGTVLVLFLIASTFKPIDTKSLETSAQVKKLLPVYNVETSEAKVAVTINCAWSNDDIDLILQTLEKHDVKATFFMVGDWVEKYRESVEKINNAGHEIRKSFIFASTRK